MSDQRIRPGLVSRMNRRTFLKMLGTAGGSIVLNFNPFFPVKVSLALSLCAPGWRGSVLINGESLTNWKSEYDDKGSFGTLQLVGGVNGNDQAVQLNWDIGTGDWVQGKYTFPQPVDLSRADLFGVSLHGGGSTEQANTVSIMFADENDVFYGYNMEGKNNGINQINRWLINLSFPKKVLYFFFGPKTQIDWSRINRFFFVVKRPPGAGGMGQLSIDDVQYDTAANWPRQTQFAVVTADPRMASKAIEYLLSQQKSTGLFLSWKEEVEPKAWLYDQALVLIALTREGIWKNGEPQNNTAQAVKKLVDFLISVQKLDGHWARGWNPNTGVELVDQEPDGTIWVGDRAWAVMALSIYANKSEDASAMSSAQRGAAWFAPQIDPLGKVVASTEGNVDVWWAMVSTSRFADADKIKNYLLDENTVWDKDLQYWWRGYQDPVIAMDAATWLSAFARDPLVNQPDKGKAALSFVRKTLVTQVPDLRPGLCGFDGMGPVSIWNEGTGQYVAAGGQDAQTFLDILISQQRADGLMPGSPENWNSDAFGWLTTWSGLAPTSWFWYTIMGSPFNPGLILGLNTTAFRRGDTLILTANVTPGPTTRTVDAYIAIKLPDGTLLFMQGDGSFTPTPQPIVRNWTVAPFSEQIFSYIFGDGVPGGAYTWLAAFTEPGTGNIIGSIVQTPFTFSP